MKQIIFTILLMASGFSAISQDTTARRDTDITVGTFSTLNESGGVSINPVIQISHGDYIFENRYGYEAPNSASINMGKRIFKNIKHVEIIPMAGLVFGSFKGVTAELQTSLNYSAWYLSLDNQYSYNCAAPQKSQYFNWMVARYIVTNFLHVGITSFFDKQGCNTGVLDKGVTVAFIFKNWAFRLYAFNYEIEKRYYWAGFRYTFKL